MKRARYLLPILAVALLPTTASANAGTPLMWASMAHLVFGNAIIGLVEGLLLSRIFKCPDRKSVFLSIVANYVSAWAGLFLVAGYLGSWPDITIDNVLFWFVVFTGVAFVFTLMIEFPFVWLLLRSQEHALRRALIATLAVNGISYVFLFGWYWMASGTSMMTRLKVVTAHEMNPPEPYTLYYLSADGNRILSMDLDRPDSGQPISDVSAHGRNDRLFARPRGESRFDLYIRSEPKDGGEGKESLVIQSFSEHAPVEWRIAKGHAEEAAGSWSNFGPVSSLAQASNWEFVAGFWAVGGIMGKNTKDGRSVRFSLETPFAAWPVRNATQLSGDYVVFQLGVDQICIMHPESRKIALITRGKGPIVAKRRMSSHPKKASADLPEP